MSCVHYKFFSQLNYNIVTFDGLHISLCDLKCRIMGREKLKVASCDLQISNAQTEEEYTDDNALIPRNSSVIVRRIPVGGVKATSKTSVRSQTEPVSGTSKAQDKSLESVPRIKKSTGIPRSFMMEVKNPKAKGAMLTNAGKYVIPIINAEAYARGKKEKPPFLPEEPSSSSDDDPIPDELLCPICRDTMTDAVVIRCCGNSYCDECIRTALLESEEHTCPTCHQTDVSPDALVANKCLRQAVNNFINGTGYRKRIQQEEQQQQPPPPPPSPPLVRQAITRNPQPLLRPKISRQQEPLMIPLASLASPSALASLAPGPSPVAAGLPISPSSVVVSDLPPAASLSLRAEKPDRPFRHADTVIPPGALVTAAELSKSSSLSTSSLLEEKGYQIPVLRQPAIPSLLGPQGQSMPTTGHPTRASTPRSAGGRPGWELSSNRGRLRGERTQRTQAPTLPASTAVFVPVPPPSLYPPPPQALPLLPRARRPQFPPQFPPGQPPSASYTDSPPGYPPAPANVSSAWVSTAVPTAHSDPIPMTQAPPLSGEEFYREHQRLKEESKSPCGASSYSGGSYTYSKSRSGFSHSCSYSPSFSCSHSHSYSRSPPCPRRGKRKRRNYRSRSRSHSYHCSKSRSPPYRRYYSDAKPEKRKKVVYEKVDKDHEATYIKASKPETAEFQTWPKGRTEPDGEKGERPPEGDKSAFLNNPAKKIELNQETGKTIVSGENVPPAKEPAEKPEPSSSKVKQEKAKGEVRRKVTAADGSSSTLVNYTSSSSTGGSAVSKTEEEPDTKRSVVETMEEHRNDITAPAEGVMKLKSEARGSQSPSSPRVSRSQGQSPSESQTRSHRGSASSGENQGSKKKKKKKEKQQHKKHKKHIGNNMELGKRQKHKHKKKKRAKRKRKRTKK